jgi:predicted nucleotidyltransferase
MRQIISSGSVKAISLNRESVLRRLKEIVEEASRAFPEIVEVRLFGSLAKGEETGLSDVDLLIVTERGKENPVERMKPYFSFFSDRMDIGVDMIVATEREAESIKETLGYSELLSRAAKLNIGNKSPSSIPDRALAEMVRRLIEAYRPERIYLFGSRARSDFGPDSDYDLLVVVPDSASPERKRSRLAYEALRGTGVAADIIVWTEEAFDRRLHLRASLPFAVVAEGKLLYA